MNELLTLLFVALVPLALSGLTVLAYKHPAAYRRVLLPLLQCGGAALLAATLWNLALAAAEGAASPFVPFEKHTEFMQAVRALTVSLSAILAGLAAGLYLYALLGLPLLLGAKEANDTERPET